MEHQNWLGFCEGPWMNEINVRDFIQKNYKEYKGDDKFLSKATPRTEGLMKKINSLFALERQYGGVLDIDTSTVSSLTNYSPGYVDKNNEIIVGKGSVKCTVRVSNSNLDAGEVDFFTNKV